MINPLTEISELGIGSKVSLKPTLLYAVKYLVLLVVVLLLIEFLQLFMALLNCPHLIKSNFLKPSKQSSLALSSLMIERKLSLFAP